MKLDPSFFIAGLGDRFIIDRNEDIVSLWQAFVPNIGRVPRQVKSWNYGLCCNPEEDGSFEYIAGTEVSRVDGLFVATANHIRADALHGLLWDYGYGPSAYIW